MTRLFQAFRSFFAILFSGKLPEDVMLDLGLMRRGTAPPPKAQTKGQTAPAPPAAPAGPTAADGAVQMLALLQQESRLIDFLLEDISAYTDDQVGAAVRGVHEGCRTVLNRHLALKPVIDGVEGAVANLSTSGVDSKDATSVKLLGNVPADGKVDSGLLRHRGWKADRVDLPRVQAGRPVRIIAPAEIELE